MFSHTTYSNKNLPTSILAQLQHPLSSVATMSGATPKSNFAYQPLNLDSREIRLVRLLPHDMRKVWTTVECEIFHTYLDSRPVYESLSYVWGDPTVIRSIRVDGNSLLVTASLHEALMALRVKEPRILWIDAICIDQANIPECLPRTRWEPG